ncbi:hypothetical protein PMIT1327_01035 [Prochlorococcus marinus str. MIT 1327]|nr:hypothetical protein PMIT1312_00730 [Prochlorococcus marinus str. MIT 1312]KZR81525.1 hypothetical protein PMIT1327_01035 [Prochlorococcus marinus str. MIT 1327]
MKSSLSKRDGIYIGLFLVLIITQIPQSARNHKINVYRDNIENYFDYQRERKTKQWDKKMKDLFDETRNCRHYLNNEGVRNSAGPFFRH